jgi:DNA-binding Lrp family transcriptional regulator
MTKAPVNPHAKTPVPVDEIDMRILNRLRDDGRISMASLADTVSVSRANAYSRVERLTQTGVIEGFSARVNSARLGLGITAVLFLKVKQPSREALIPAIRAIAGIEYSAYVTGEHDVMMIVRAPDVESLRDENMGPLFEQPHVQSSHTILVLDEVVHRPYVLP